MENAVDRTPRSMLKKNYEFEKLLAERNKLQLAIKLTEKKIEALDKECKSLGEGTGLNARLKVRKSWSASWDYQTANLKKIEERIAKERKKQVFG